VLLGFGDEHEHFGDVPDAVQRWNEFQRDVQESSCGVRRRIQRRRRFGLADCRRTHGGPRGASLRRIGHGHGRKSRGRCADGADGPARKPAFVCGKRFDAPGDRVYVGGCGGEGGGTARDSGECCFDRTGAAGARFARAGTAGESLYQCSGRGGERGSSGRCAAPARPRSSTP